MLDPSRISQPASPAAATVESVIVDRKEFAAVDNLETGPHVRDLQIDYTSPTFSIPQKVKFRYKLDGYDEDWHEAGPRRQAFYTDVRRRLERGGRNAEVLHRSGVLPDDLVSGALRSVLRRPPVGRP
jgi:hypothetical protein